MEMRERGGADNDAYAQSTLLAQRLFPVHHFLVQLDEDD